jgi:hypothetical protein
VQQEVLESWTNQHLIETYLQPVLDSFGKAFDFVEIGSCDYDTLCDPLKTGLLVEPLDVFTKNLTNTVERVALYEGPEPFVPIYYTTHYHDWKRGCNKILQPHPSVEPTHMRYVPTMSWQALVKKHKIRYIETLKITVEGYDSILLQAVLKTIQDGLYIHNIVCLWNELVPKCDLGPLKELYTVIETGSHLICERTVSLK